MNIRSACIFTLLLTGLLSVQAQSNIGRGRIQGLYQKHCAVCHGARGEGGLGGALNQGEWQHAKTDEERTRVIRDGLPDLGMQGFGDVLNEKEIRALVIYMRELETMAQREKPRANAAGIHQTERQSFRIEDVARNSKRMWGVTFMPDGRFLATEIDGNVRFISADGTLAPPIENIPKIRRRGQGGMLDVALDPEYEENGWVYLVFSHGNSSGAMTSLVRGKIQGNRWTDEEVLFRAKDKDYRGAGTHFGSRIVFEDDYVFFAIGDRGDQQQAQSLNVPNGKVHRLHRDGRIPEDNPFVGKSPYPSIWTYGNRNPQALVFHPETGVLWSTEHGPRGGDELNVIQKGKNYGWPKVTFGMNYNGTPITEHTTLPGMEPPVWHWTPSIAVCGMSVADGRIYPGWKGDLLIGGLRSQVLERIRIEDGELKEREVVLQGAGRVRDVKTAPNGTVYLILENNGSRLVRLIPVAER